MSGKIIKTGKTLAKLSAAGAAFYVAAGGVMDYITLNRRIYDRNHRQNTKRGAKKAALEAAKKASEPVIDKHLPETERDRICREAAEWHDLQNIEKIQILNRSGETVHCQLIRSPYPSELWCVCIHGYTSDPRGMSLYAKEFNRRGYNVLLPVMRGHAESEHNYVSMGWHDRFDVEDWIKYIVRLHPAAQIILHGISMGGATVMMITGDPLPENVKCALEDCGYTSVWEEFSDQLKVMYKLPVFPFLFAANSVAKRAFKLDFKEASSVEQLKKSVTPTLFIHGEQDTFVHFKMLDRVYEACAAQKDKLIIPDATHANSAEIHSDLYWNKVDEFLTKHIGSKTANAV
ncbi:MAG: alpha/beta hydrolase [Clostridiales bacterium]|nr:alpha/beta hydrolase [Clostridiales bacterium]